MEKQQVEPQMRQPGGNKQGRKLGQMRFLPSWKKCFENASSSRGIKVSFQHFPLIFTSLNRSESISIWYVYRAYFCGKGECLRFTSILFSAAALETSLKEARAPMRFWWLTWDLTTRMLLRKVNCLGYLNFFSFSLYSPPSHLLLSLH